MSIIKVNTLSKHFKILNRHEGFLGTLKDLFSRDYKIIKAVDEISLEVKKGEILGFIGPNGAGKSTTIKMLTGVLKPSSGEININGCIPYKQRKQYVKNIGVVFGQRTQLWWDLPVIESFKILKEIYRIEKKHYDDNLNIFNQVVDLKKLYTIPVRQLSLGQRTLCDIAASFLHNPPLIFMDEPTIGLDISIKNKVRKIIGKLNQIKKTTVVITSHDLGDIESLCKRIILIDKGKIIFDGCIEEINKFFGTYRTLKLELSNMDDEEHKKIRESIDSNFPASEGITIQNDKNGWCVLTINQDKVKLSDVLNYLMKIFSVKDVKIEEISLETIIRKIYEGKLL